MANNIVQLKDYSDNNVYPIAGAATQGSITKAMLEEGIFEGQELSQPSSVAYVATDNIQDGAVTSDKIDCETVESTRMDTNNSLTGDWKNLNSLSGVKKDDVVVGRMLIKNTGSTEAVVQGALTHTDGSIWEYQAAAIPANGSLTMLLWQKCTYNGDAILKARVPSGTASTQYFGMLNIRQLNQ